MLLSLSSKINRVGASRIETFRLQITPRLCTLQTKIMPSLAYVCCHFIHTKSSQPFFIHALVVLLSLLSFV
eukprot:c35270_g1_i1 orf=80-292(-)